jgi:alpha-1,2-mannosyltransferase
VHVAIVERGRSVAGRLGLDRVLVRQLAVLAVLAFLLRLLPVLVSGGLQGIIDYDDGVYMGTALSLVRGRIVYRDFFMLHPPGIVYVLLPFASLSWLFSDATAFAAARVGFMLLGALNTFLVGVIAARYGRTAALASAALYAVWIVAAKVERSTWLIAPQNTLLLLALLVLLPSLAGAKRQPITWRKAALVGALIGFCGAIQIWGLVTAGVIFVWLVLRTVRQPGGWLRPVVAYSVAGVTTVALTFLPFLVAAGEKMIRIVIFDQIGRGESGVGISARMRILEGIPHPVISRLGLTWLPLLVFVLVMLAVVFVAWRRRGVRLWAALFIAQCAFLLVTPSFFGHYSGWIAPAAALCIGMVAASAIEWSALRPRLTTAIKAAYAAGLAGCLFVTLLPWLVGLPSPSNRFPAQAVADAIQDAHCPTGDSPSVLILTGALRRMLDDGCPLLVSPTGVSYDTDPDLRGKDRTRTKQPEYQAVMQSYFGGADAAMFSRSNKNLGLSDATWAVIRAHLPVEVRRGQVMILLPAGP